MARRDLERPRRLRAARRHLHAGGHVRGDRPGSPPRGPRRHRGRADAARRRFPAPRNWGYDGVAPFAPGARYGDARRPPALRRRAHRSASRSPRRRLQPPRARTAPTSARSAPYYFSEAAPDARGARRSTSTDPAASRCALLRRERACTGSTSTTSTACGSTRATRSIDESAEHFLAELQRPGGSAATRERARPDHRRGPSQPREHGAARGRGRLRPRRRVGGRLPPPVRAAARRGPRGLLRRLHGIGRGSGRGRSGTAGSSPANARPFRWAARDRPHRASRRELRRVPPEPRSGGQPRPRRAASPPGRPGHVAGGLDAVCFSARRRRCCSWGRSGEPRARFSSSPTTTRTSAAA